MSGLYVLRASNLPSGLMVTEVLADGVDVIDSGVEITRNMDVEVVLGPQSALTGTVADARGRPVASAAVVVFAEDPARWSLTQTRYVRTMPVRSDGSFNVEGLGPARYYVAAFRTEPGRPPGDVEDLERLIPGAARVTIRNGESTSVSVRID